MHGNTWNVILVIREFISIIHAFCSLRKIKDGVKIKTLG